MGILTKTGSVYRGRAYGHNLTIPALHVREVFGSAPRSIHINIDSLKGYACVWLDGHYRVDLNGRQIAALGLLPALRGEYMGSLRWVRNTPRPQRPRWLREAHADRRTKRRKTRATQRREWTKGW